MSKACRNTNFQEEGVSEKYEIEVIGEVGRNPRLFRGMEFQERCSQCHMLQRVPRVRRSMVPCRHYFQYGGDLQSTYRKL